MVYFQQFDGLSYPDYVFLVARWEWPPWLLLTGFGEAGLYLSDSAIRLYPCVVEEREHRYFNKNPFVRSLVTFYYNHNKENPIRIYEEFTFNSKGEMTFIEAWSADLLTARDSDNWPTFDAVKRLSVKIPGLRNSSRSIDLNSVYFKRAARKDEDVKNFRDRALNFTKYIIKESIDNSVNLKKKFYATNKITISTTQDSEELSSRF
jgi:hypothetical protein